MRLMSKKIARRAKLAAASVMVAQFLGCDPVTLGLTAFQILLPIVLDSVTGGSAI